MHGHVHGIDGEQHRERGGGEGARAAGRVAFGVGMDSGNRAGVQRDVAVGIGALGGIAGGGTVAAICPSSLNSHRFAGWKC